MAKGFPPELTEYLRDHLVRVRQDTDIKSTIGLFAKYSSVYGSSGMYSFTESLRTGNYVHYGHEAEPLKVGGYNCTTLIPTMYTIARELGYNPQIVQFKGFRDIKSKNNTSSKKDPAAHFSLIVDVGRKQPYLVDAFYQIFGPIIEEEEGHLIIGKTNGSSYKRREFDEKNLITEEAFAEMMQTLRDPAESLDMIIAGQKPYSSVDVEGVKYCDHKVFYTEESNTVSFRIYQSVPCLSDRAITMHHKMDDEGRTLEKQIDLSFAKVEQWRTLIGEEKLATVSLNDLYKLRRGLKPFCDVMKRPRFGPLAKAHPKVREIMVEFTKSQGIDISSGLIDKISPKKLIARVLYEWCQPDGPEYFSTKEQRVDYLRKLSGQIDQINDSVRDIGNALWSDGWKIDRLNRNEARRLRRKKERMTKGRAAMLSEIDALNYLRKHNEPFFARLLDQYFFAKSLVDPDSLDFEISATKDLSGLELGSLDKVVEQNKGNLLFPETYAAMVLDFLPSVIDAKRFLDPKHFIEPMRPKIKARRAKLK